MSVKQEFAHGCARRAQVLEIGWTRLRYVSWAPGVPVWLASIAQQLLSVVVPLVTNIDGSVVRSLVKGAAHKAL